MQSMKLCWSLLVLASLSLTVEARRGGCTRRLPAGVTDCTTADGECELLYHSDSPELAVSLLPHTPSNTRTCYRTCFEGDECKAFATSTSPRGLRVEGESPYRFQRVFSPQSDDGIYRKSTICRYSVECDPGQILSYSVHSFDLENRVNCSSGEECVDWVEVTYHHLGQKERFCGARELGQLHLVGHNKISFEFVSNRRAEAGGFLYFVQCFDEDITDQDTAVTESCSKPPGSQPRRIMPKYLNYNPINDRRGITVEKKWFLIYKGNVIAVFAGRKWLWRKIEGVRSLTVEYRVSKSTRVYYPSRKYKIFNGYGVLSVRQGRAYYYQTGVNPLIEPSQKEAEAILKIESVLNDLIEKDTFDVADYLDYQESGSFRTPFVSRPTFRPHTPLLSEAQRFVKKQYANVLAAEYGHACNPVLRATACSYQAAVQGRDCKTGLAL